jgi:proteasome alpha subunit
MEAFTRAPEDVSLRRLVGFGLSPQLKTNFEQIFSAPFLVELLLVEVGGTPEQDLLVRLHFDGGFNFAPKGLAVAAAKPEAETAAQNWLLEALAGKSNRAEVIDLLLQAWWCLIEDKPCSETPEQERRGGWHAALEGKVAEVGWLARKSSRSARFEMVPKRELQL